MAVVGVAELSAAVASAFVLVGVALWAFAATAAIALPPIAADPMAAPAAAPATAPTLSTWRRVVRAWIRALSNS
jgi:hypothetical protein